MKKIQGLQVLHRATPELYAKEKVKKGEKKKKVDRKKEVMDRNLK